jgi:hypothetical protein
LYYLKNKEINALLAISIITIISVIIRIYLIKTEAYDDIGYYIAVYLPLYDSWLLFENLFLGAVVIVLSDEIAEKITSLGADIIIMLHPDYQYDPKLIPELIQKVEEGADIVLGSRMLKGKEAIRNGMLVYKYISNRALTIFQNIFLKQNLSEYHTGYRAFRKDVLNNLNFSEFSDDFIFDNQILIGAVEKGYTINEVYCPAKYADDSSSINLRRSIKYGLLVICYTFRYLLKRK